MDVSQAVTPEGLGEYLTSLVAAKNRWYPDDDAELMAAGILGLLVALERTSLAAPTIATRMKALTLVLSRHFHTWPSEP